MVGCASTKIISTTADNIGDSFVDAASRGESAAKSIKAWPFISGQIRGVFADNYELEVPLMAKNIMKSLDGLAAKESLTAEEQGLVVGYYVRLEAIALEFGWSKYGVSIWNMLKKFVGGF
jgi:hypothetical protein